MILPKIFSTPTKPSETQLVLGLILSNSKVQALLLEVGGTETTIVHESRALEYADQAQLLHKADEALQDLGPSSETTNQTIFCFESSWVNDGDIIDAKKPIVKKMTADLSLEALGFIVTSEALSHYFVQENALFSGVLFLFNTATITATLISQGQLVGEEEVGRSDNPVADVEEALARCVSKHKTSNGLPPKMMLASFDLTTDELKKQQQQLLDYNWSAQNLFLQPPVIEVVSPELFSQYVASEAAKAVLVAKGFSQVGTPTSGASIELKEDDAEEEVEDVVPMSDSPSDSSEEALPKPSVPDALVDEVERAVEPSVSSFGIPIAASKLPELAPARSADFSEEFAVVDNSKRSEPKSEVHQSKSWLSTFTKPYTGKRSTRFFVILGLLLGIVALVGVVFAWANFFSKITIEVVPKASIVSKEIEISLNPQATETDPAKRELAAKAVTRSLSDQSTMQTTGVKLVGDKAKGKVQLFNKTDAEKTFAAGTQLTAGGLSFSLDSEVTIASASTKPISGGEEKVYGQKEASVTALAIGEEGNLAKETSFTVEKFAQTTYAASSVEAFTGGASREVRVVAAADRSELLSDMRKELLKKAKETFESESQGGTYYLPTNTIEDETSEYSAKEGEEANELTLSLEISVRGLSYTTSDLKPIAEAVLADEVQSGYELSTDDLQILSAPLIGASGSAEAVTRLQANLSARAYPQLNEAEIISNVSGKSFAVAESDLSAMTGVERATIHVSPPILQSLIISLPRSEKRVIVVFNRE